jgi:hypothetical protein
VRASFPQRFHFMADGEAFNAASLAEDHDDLGTAMNDSLDLFKAEVLKALLAQVSPAFSSDYRAALRRLETAPLIRRQSNPVRRE